MLSALLAVLSAAPAGVITLGERDPVEVVVRAPYADDRGGDRSALVAAVDRAVRKAGALFARGAPDTPELLEAKADPVRLLRALRPDLDVARSLEEQELALRQAGQPPVQLIVVLTLLQDGDATRISGMLIDVPEALASLRRGLDAEDPTGRLEQEGALLRLPPERGDRAALEAYVERRLSAELEGMIARHPSWGSPARLRIKSELAGAEIQLDGRVVGATGDEEVELVELRPGSRKLRVDAQERGRFEIELPLAPGESRELEAVFVGAASTGAGRVAVRWSGVALGAAGVAFLVASAAGASGSGLECSDTTGTFARCPAAPWARLGDAGPALAPLGYSLLGAGAVWALGPETLESEGFPWISVALGAALGVASYSISVALEPAAALKP